MNDDAVGSEPRRYRVDVSDSADQEADSIFLWMNRNRGPGAAEKWYRGLAAAFDSLSTFPYRIIAIPGQPEVHRLLHGSYRVLYRVIEPTEPDEVGIVRILRVVHGARDSAA